MPACASEQENLSGFFSSSPPLSRSSSVSPVFPGSPLSSSPPKICSMNYLKRSTSDISSTNYNLRPISPSGKPGMILRRVNTEKKLCCESKSLRNHSPEPSTIVLKPEGLFSRLVTWYINCFFGVFSGLFETLIFMIRAPALWASAWIWIFLAILQLPLTLIKWFITMLYTPASELARSKRCVLISGGSTVQAVHLARNFYKAGARVIVCEVEGLFSLARFSVACSKFYRIPRPGPGNAAEYVKALKNIVEKEKAIYYIPVSVANAAYYDALAKPHLEILGCECFVPSAFEVTALDDPLELIQRCRSVGLPTPRHFVLRSADDVLALYDSGAIRAGRHMLLAAGPAGMRDRIKVQLPPSAQEFQNIRHLITEKRPWLIIRDPGSCHFITCTTVKNSKVVANVTCRVDEAKGLIPENRNDVTLWLERFFSHSFGSINGHLSFRLVLSNNNELVSIGCRVGIGLPYICLTSVHPRLIWRTCRHFSRQNSGPLLMTDKCEDILPSPINGNIKQQKIVNSISSVLDKKEALFVYWDPLPYCAYYHLQLSFFRIPGFFPARHNPPLAVIQ